MVGRSARPASAAALSIVDNCSRVPASGSPHSAKMSASAAPTAYAAADEPPNEIRGRGSRNGLMSAMKRSNR